jgi:tetratricopeptide (TPR) repeat protein
MGKNAEAERLLREVVKAQPELYQIHYSLGLLLAEEKQYVEAAEHLAIAARGMPNHARAHYNMGLLLDYLQKDSEAETALLRAVQIEPENIDFLTAAAEYYLKRKQFAKAKPMAERIVAIHPTRRIGPALLGVINRQMESENP